MTTNNGPASDLLYLSAATMRHAVAESLGNVPLTGADSACAVLAYRLAGVIDDAEDQAEALKFHGPRLLSVLEQLKATPKSRPTAPAAPSSGGALAALRDGR